MVQSTKLLILFVTAFASLSNAAFNYRVLQTQPSAGVVNQDFASNYRIVHTHEDTLYHVIYVDALDIKPQYNFHVSIERGNDVVCSGALLTNGRHVITAASCGVKTTDIVRLSAVYLRQQQKKVVGITCVKNHYGFHRGSHHYDHDIAILRINETIRDLNTVYPYSPGPLPNRGEVTHYSTLAGWKFKDSLVVTNVPILSAEECRRKYGFHLTNNMLCAGDYSPNASFCSEDSGNPLFERGTLIGIKSWGQQCSRAVIPAVFTDVSAHKDWILSTISSVDC